MAKMQLRWCVRKNGASRPVYVKRCIPLGGRVAAPVFAEIAKGMLEMGY